MPELPEVETFRKLLLPLVSSSFPLSVELTGTTRPPKTFLGASDVERIHRKVCVQNVLRKGKLLCLVLKGADDEKELLYLFLHMGMTGRISTPERVCKLESQTSTQYPPPATIVVFQVVREENRMVEACFSDPRKFGSAFLSERLEEGFGPLAVDALEFAKDEDGHVQWENQRLRIKTLLLDQNRIVSGVGNWIADEVLYQSEMHPDQTHLTKTQARRLHSKLDTILTTAVDCLDEHKDFPEEWLFHVRWSKRKKKVMDFHNRPVQFVTSSGRTSAIVPAIQRLCPKESEDGDEEKEEKHEEENKGSKRKTKKEADERVEKKEPKQNKRRKAAPKQEPESDAESQRKRRQAIRRAVKQRLEEEEEEEEGSISEKAKASGPARATEQ